MSYQIPPDVEQLVWEHLRQGDYGSADEVLRDVFQALAERNDDLAALRAGIEDMEAGRVLPLAEADAAIRQKLGFAPPQ